MEKIKRQKPANLLDADLYGVYRSWRDNTGIFECYVRATCFVSLQHYPDFVLGRVNMRRDAVYQKIHDCVAKELETSKECGGKVLFLLDLPAQKSLPASLLLNHDCGLQPVLTMRQLFHPYGIVGGKAEISALLSVGPRLHRTDPAGFAFILDSGRFLDDDANTYTEKFNNQYELSAYDLPVLEMLRDAGYTKLVLMHSAALKRDVADYIGCMRVNGFNACTLRVEGHL